MRDNYSFAIIGGGASGLACAVTLARLLPKADITVYEKLQSAGKKILATGNGRCNLSNEYTDVSCYGGSHKLARLILDSFSPEDCLAFWSSIGLKTTVEDGRVYPLSMNASSVRGMILAECDRLGVIIKTDHRLEKIERDSEADGFSLTFSNSEGQACSAYADFCILALGGKAAAAHGTDGDGYRILKNLGVRYEPIYPALVQIKTKEEITKALKGVRVHGKISLFNPDSKPGSKPNSKPDSMQPLESAEGEILFTDYGVSGIPAMQISASAAQLSSQLKAESDSEEAKTSPILSIDLCPSMSEEEIVEYIAQRQQSHEKLLAADALLGIMNDKLAEAVVRHENHGLQENAQTAHTIKNFTLTVIGTNGFKDAQTTRGGVSTDALKPESLETESVPGLFICGELLNVDGICGGYNLHFAWGSGIFAAKEAARLAQNK